MTRLNLAAQLGHKHCDAPCRCTTPPWDMPVVFDVFEIWQSQTPTKNLACKCWFVWFLGWCYHGNPRTSFYKAQRDWRWKWRWPKSKNGLPYLKLTAKTPENRSYATPKGKEKVFQPLGIFAVGCNTLPVGSLTPMVRIFGYVWNHNLPGSWYFWLISLCLFSKSSFLRCRNFACRELRP